ncbi:MAG TPA: cbb3-type cytochrome oxidase assembly protein CcoS [Candidatus Sulfomarinibacteraceae bacterium]|nr:cbb3-type cytochrome oxidase assembly protein CcoS [Candidatus Sulfomarinibacteraceae bacterium]
MSAVYIALPVALLLAVAGVVAFIWAVRSGQMDDLETPGQRILVDDQPSDGVPGLPQRDNERVDADDAEPDDAARDSRPPDRRD